MFGQFYGADSTYHELRRRFVEKTRPSETSPGLAKHLQQIGGSKLARIAA